MSAIRPIAALPRRRFRLAMTTPGQIMIACLAVLLVAVPWQLRWGVVHDVSFIITTCERMLAGETLYIDLFEVNPPFTFWLFLPAVALADVLHLSPELVVHAFAYAICILGLGLGALLAHRAKFRDNVLLAPLLPAFLAVLVLLPGNSFAQRDQLGVALLVPLLVLMRWRIGDETESAPGVGLALLAGICGSVLVLVKPYYALIIIAPALYVAWRRRSVRSLLSPEYWVIATACLAYLGAVAWFHPQFLTAVYPVLAETYMRIRLLPAVLLKFGGGYLAALFFLWYLRPGRAIPPLVAILALASIAGIVPLLYQAKTWAYHAYPAISLVIAALLVRAVQPDPPGGLAGTAVLDRGRKLLLGLVILANLSPFLSAQKPDAEFVSTIRAAVARPVVAIMGSGLQVAFPLVRMVDGRWTSAYASDWLGAFAAYLGLLERSRGDTAAADHYDAMVERYLDVK